MDLTTNGVVITDAIKHVQGQMDHLNKSEKVLLQVIKEKNEEQPEEILLSKRKPTMEYFDFEVLHFIFDLGYSLLH